MQQIREELLSSFHIQGEMKDEDVLERIDQALIEHGKRQYISRQEKEQLSLGLFHSVRKLDVLQELVDDKDISEIMINGPADIFIERGGKLEKWKSQFASKEKLEDVIQQMVSKQNRRVNETDPIVDTRLENGSRVNVILSPVALNGPIVTIRRFPEQPYSMNQLVEFGTLSETLCIFLKDLVLAGYNIFISGGTGSGKTTFLNALASYIPADERIITIEDSAELNLKGISNLVRLETRNENIEGKNQISIRDLIRTSLRARPDRIIVGEVRGGESLDMLQAMNTGHDGSMSTGHANSCQDMLRRLETMVLMGTDIPILAIRGQIASGIDVMIHLGRLRDRSRKLLSIEEVSEMKDGEVILNPLYVFRETGEENGKITGEWKKLGELLQKRKLQEAGIRQQESEK